MRILILCLIVLLAACNKDNMGRCEDLKEALASNNKEKAKQVINKFIDDLPSENYTEENINRLSQSIAGKCDVNTSIQCFDCIQTLPSQTEILINFSYNGAQLQKVIDLSYSADQKIVFYNIHD